MLSKEEKDRLTKAHATATGILTSQLRRNPAFTEAVIDQFVGLMNQHRHLMLVALNDGRAIEQDDTAVSPPPEGTAP